MFEVRIPAHQTADVWETWNVKGHLAVRIRTRSGSNRIPDVWWIKHGFGTVDHLGPQVDHFETDSPIGWLPPVLHAKLRAAADEDTILYIEINGAAPGATLTFHW